MSTQVSGSIKFSKSLDGIPYAAIQCSHDQDTAVASVPPGIVAMMKSNLQDRKFSLAGLAPNRSSIRKDSEGIVSFDEEFNTQDETKVKGMVKSHYVDKNSRTKCCNCRKKFSLKSRPRHCRRCGELFCMKCLQYKRNLNQLSHPDPAGKPRKVCKRCFEADSFTGGSTRTLTEDFISEREATRNEKATRQRENSLTNSFCRNEVDIPRECTRILEGFGRDIGPSVSKKTVQEVRGVVQIPVWQKSSFWKVERLAQNCRQCKGGLGMLKKKRNCKICGLSLCKKCSRRELLVYYDDKGDVKKRTPKIGIINVPGCPDKEPNVSLLLHVCLECRTDITDKQSLDPAWFLQHTVSDPISQLITMDTAFTQLHGDIVDQMNQCEQTLEKFETGDSLKNMTATDSNLLQDVLGTLRQNLDEYLSHFHRLKCLLGLAESKTQSVLIQNYTKSKFDFYMEGNHGYRNLRKRINESTLTG